MAEKHDYLLSRYRARLEKSGHKIETRSPFVDYRPDIYATKEAAKVFAEVEIDRTLYSDHTRSQLTTMYEYLVRDRRNRGVVVVPRALKVEAEFLIRQIFGDRRIGVDGL